MKSKSDREGNENMRELRNTVKGLTLGVCRS